MSSFYDKSPGRQVVICLMYAMCWLAFLSSTTVTVVMYLYGKLKFQFDRLIFMTLIAQILATLPSVFLIANDFNTKWFAALHSCPTDAGELILISISNTFFVVAVLCEGVMVLVANFQLFVGRRELNISVERILRVVLIVFGCILLAVNLYWYFSENNGHCGKHDKYNPIQVDRFNKDLWAGMAVPVFAAYALLNARKVWQYQTWRAQMEALNDEAYGFSDVQTTVQLTLIKQHESVVRECVWRLERYLLAFIVCSAGFIINLVAVYGKSEKFSVHQIAMIIIFSQPVLQSAIYISSKENRSCFHISNWIANTKAYFGGRRRVTINEDANLSIELIDD
eukprot:m.84152 g.84152  ORF g.84152 m.84152 type:complete len:338 (+) comp12954_c0_seq3:150-1163(+)